MPAQTSNECQKIDWWYGEEWWNSLTQCKLIINKNSVENVFRIVFEF